MPAVLTTRRLLLRTWNPEDAAFFYALSQDPEVMRYAGEDPFGSLAQALAFVQSYDQFERNGFGRWLVEDRLTGESLGWCGLKLETNGNGPEDLKDGFIDLGYRFARKHWSRGLATEAGWACLCLGFQRLGMQRIIGRAVPENTASVRVLEKLGMQKFWEGECDLHYAHYLSVDRSQFESVRTGRYSGFSVQFE